MLRGHYCQSLGECKNKTQVSRMQGECSVYCSSLELFCCLFRAHTGGGGFRGSLLAVHSGMILAVPKGHMGFWD